MSNKKRDLNLRVTKKEKENFKAIQKLEDNGVKFPMPVQPKLACVTPLQQDGELYIVLPDLHRPYHNQILWEKILQIIENLGPQLKGVVFSGDYLDLFTLGSYNAESLGLLKDITLEEEYEDGLKGLLELEAVLNPQAEKYFIWGNHEERYNTEMKKRDNAKYGNSLISPSEALQLNELGYKEFKNWKDDVVTIGNVDIAHGTFWNIHCAKKHLDENKRSIMFGHTHRMQSYSDGTQTSHNIGCLVDLKSHAFHYMPRLTRNKWTNGFAFITVDNNQSHVEVIKVDNSNFYWRGKKY